MNKVKDGEEFKKKDDDLMGLKLVVIEDFFGEVMKFLVLLL